MSEVKSVMQMLNYVRARKAEHQEGSQEIADAWEKLFPGGPMTLTMNEEHKALLYLLGKKIDHLHAHVSLLELMLVQAITQGLPMVLEGDTAP